MAKQPAAKIVMLDTASLIPGDDFRLDDDPEALAELAASIAELGVLQPLLVRTNGGGWQVVAGRRRLAAARTAGLDTVPCVVRTDLDGDRAPEAALAENTQRRNLSWVEIAAAYGRLRDSGVKQSDIAKRVGRSETHVSQVLTVLKMVPELQARLHRREISYITAIDLHKRGLVRDSHGRKGGGRAHATGPDSDIASHWRRRHDRVVAGLHALLTATPPRTDVEWRTLVDRLVKLDLKPLDQTRANGKSLPTVDIDGHTFEVFQRNR